MWFFWVFALVPIVIGVILLWCDKHIAWQEVIISTLVALVMAAIFQCVALFGLTYDIETLSGQITDVTHYGAWTEQYEESHTRTVGSGKDAHTETYYTTEYDHHSEKWSVSRDFGVIQDEPNVDEEYYNVVKQTFGGGTDNTGRQSCDHFGGRYWSGDNTYYVTANKTQYIHPVTTTKHFENRIKAAPTLFSFPKVPTNIVVYAWPDNPDWTSSQRILGTAQSMFNTRDWDLLNSNLGPQKKINLIVVGFPAGFSMEIAKWQEAKWIGGKKNDLVICYAGGSSTSPAEWAYVFGWTEKTIVKLNIQDLFTQNSLNSSLIPKVSSEVMKNYEKKNWHKFDYIRIEPPIWSYWVYLLTIFCVQGGMYIWFHLNDLEDGNGSGRRYGYSFSNNYLSFGDLLSSWFDRLFSKR
jgi:hypothetical protein